MVLCYMMHQEDVLERKSLYLHRCGTTAPASAFEYRRFYNFEERMIKIVGRSCMFPICGILIENVLIF